MRFHNPGGRGGKASSGVGEESGGNGGLRLSPKLPTTRAVSDQTKAPRHCERPPGRRARGEAIQAATAAYDHWIASSLRFSQ